jgi:hypothetical protein
MPSSSSQHDECCKKEHFLVFIFNFIVVSFFWFIDLVQFGFLYLLALIYILNKIPQYGASPTVFS